MSNRQSLHFSTSPAFIDSLQSPIRFMSLQNKKVKYKGLGLLLEHSAAVSSGCKCQPTTEEKRALLLLWRANICLALK